MRQGAPYRWEVVVEPELVRVIAGGAFDLERASRSLTEGVETAAREDRTVVLADGRGVQPPEPSTSDRYDLGIHIARLSAAHGGRIRLAVVAEEPVLDPERLGEVVAANRLANVRGFSDLDEAEAWLAAWVKD